MGSSITDRNGSARLRPFGGRGWGTVQDYGISTRLSADRPDPCRRHIWKVQKGVIPDAIFPPCRNE